MTEALALQRKAHVVVGDSTVCDSFIVEKLITFHRNDGYCPRG